MLLQEAVLHARHMKIVLMCAIPRMSTVLMDEWHDSCRLDCMFEKEEWQTS